MWQDEISFVEPKANTSASPGHKSVASWPASINERIFREHLARNNFQVGVDRDWWRLVEITWPFAVMALRGRVGTIDQDVAIRFRLDQYPLKPPGVDLWNVRSRKIVEARQWPTWFDSFVATLHPTVVVVGLVSYTPKLLRISATIARKLKEQDLEYWDPSGDLTQCLIPLWRHFRFTSQLRTRNGKRETLVTKDTIKRGKRRATTLRRVDYEPWRHRAV
jgi:hypothetical protein